MINIDTFFKNHFHSLEITDGRLKAFCDDHIQKLTSWLTVHPDAELSALLADLQTKYNTYFGAISDERTKLANQLGDTGEVDNAWMASLEFIRRKEGLIIDKWGRGSAKYLEFYPHGLDDYNHATKQDKDTLLVFYLNAATKYAADLGPQFITDFTNLKNDWTTKFNTQQQQIGLVKDADSQVEDTRHPVEVALSANILEIAFKNIGHPEMVNDFFNQSMLLSHPHALPVTSVIIKGKVISLGDGEPVADVPVMLRDPDGKTFTKKTTAKGNFYFRFDHLKPGTGTVVLEVHAPGFEFYADTFEGSPGNVYKRDIHLTPAQSMLRAA